MVLRPTVRRLLEYRNDARQLDPQSFAERHGNSFLLHYGPIGEPEEEIDLETTQVREYTPDAPEKTYDPKADFMVFPVRQRSTERADKAIWIGRGSQNDIHVPDPSVSTMHAFVRADEQGRFFLQDMLSKNGTYINGQRVPALGIGEPMEFRTGDRIHVGTVKLSFLSAQDFRNLVNQLCG